MVDGIVRATRVLRVYKGHQNSCRSTSLFTFLFGASSIIYFIFSDHFVISEVCKSFFSPKYGGLCNMYRGILVKKIILRYT